MPIERLDVYASKKLRKAHILRYFKELNEELKKLKTRGEILLLGGTAMVMGFDARPATKDVDAIFKPASMIRQAANKVAERNGLDEQWLNDAAKGYESKEGKSILILKLSHLVIYTPTMEYMLAMKSRSARLDSMDRKDLEFLIKKMGISTPEEVFDIVDKHYPRRVIKPATQFFIEEIIDDINSRSDA